MSDVDELEGVTGPPTSSDADACIASESTEDKCQHKRASERFDSSEFNCSICYELLIDPVVGNCGHDFCKQCIEEWRASRQQAGHQVQCPICRSVLLPNAEQPFGVCIRLREMIERLFPDQVSSRRNQLEQAATSKPCPLGSQASGTTSDTTSTTTSGSGHAPPSGRFPIDPELLNTTAEQYRELSRLISVITAAQPPVLAAAAAALYSQPPAPHTLHLVPPVPQPTAGSTANEQAHYQSQSAQPGYYPLTQGFVHNPGGALDPSLYALDPSATAAYQSNAMLQAAMRVLSSAAATSTAAGNLSHLVSSMQETLNQQPLQPESSQALQAGVMNVQQLTAETAAVNNILRAQVSVMTAQSQPGAHALLQPTQASALTANHSQAPARQPATNAVPTAAATANTGTQYPGSSAVATTAATAAATAHHPGSTTSATAAAMPPGTLQGTAPASLSAFSPYQPHTHPFARTSIPYANPALPQPSATFSPCFPGATHPLCPYLAASPQLCPQAPTFPYPVPPQYAGHTYAYYPALQAMPSTAVLPATGRPIQSPNSAFSVVAPAATVIAVPTQPTTAVTCPPVQPAFAPSAAQPSWNSLPRAGTSQATSGSQQEVPHPYGHRRPHSPSAGATSMADSQLGALQYCPDTSPAPSYSETMQRAARRIRRGGSQAQLADERMADVSDEADS